MYGLSEEEEDADETLSGFIVSGSDSEEETGRRKKSKKNQKVLHTHEVIIEPPPLMLLLFTQETSTRSSSATSSSPSVSHSLTLNNAHPDNPILILSDSESNSESERLPRIKIKAEPLTGPTAEAAAVVKSTGAEQAKTSTTTSRVEDSKGAGTKTPRAQVRPVMGVTTSFLILKPVVQT